MKPTTKFILILGLIGSLSLSKPAHAAHVAQSPPEDPIVEAHDRNEDINITAYASGWSRDRTRNKLS